jgi:hypothetical protein
MDTLSVKTRLYQVGDLFTTLKSGTTGVIKEIHRTGSGSARVLLDVGGKDRWTSVSAEDLDLR